MKISFDKPLTIERVTNTSRLYKAGFMPINLIIFISDLQGGDLPVCARKVQQSAARLETVHGRLTPRGSAIRKESFSA